MSAENDICRCGRYIMLKSYLMQMLILLLREQSEPVLINTGCSSPNNSGDSRETISATSPRSFPFWEWRSSTGKPTG